MLDTVKNAPVNGLDLQALGEVVEEIQKDSSKAIVGFDVVTKWKGQTRSETAVTGFNIAGERVKRSHSIIADEPLELLGGCLQRLHHGWLRCRRFAQGHQPRLAGDPHEG